MAYLPNSMYTYMDVWIQYIYRVLIKSLFKLTYSIDFKLLINNIQIYFIYINYIILL